MDAGRADGKATPKLDLHLQGQVEHSAWSPKAKLLLEGEEGNGIPSSIFVIPQLWFRIIFTPWPRESLASKFCSLIYSNCVGEPLQTFQLSLREPL